MADGIARINGLHKGEIFEGRIKRKEPYFPTTPIIDNGRRNMTRFPEYKDFAGTMGNLSKVASWFFWLLVSKRDYKTNEVHYLPSDMKERNRIQRAYPELYKLDLVRRVKRGVYMLNPGAVIPATSDNDFEPFFKKWDKFKKGKP